MSYFVSFLSFSLIFFFFVEIFFFKFEYLLDIFSIKNPLKQKGGHRDNSVGKALSAKVDYLISILGAHVVEEENQVPQTVL